MTNNRQTTISIFLIILILILVVFFWVAYAGKDLGSDLMSSYGKPLAQSGEDVSSALEPVFSAEYSETPTFSTSTSTPTDSPMATATPTITPTMTATLSFSGNEVIGHSVLERPLEVFRFGTGAHPYMIIAGIHGGYEWNTVALANELIELLKNEPSRIPTNRTLYILPNLNPDGYANNLGPDWRANANNVDINRNWDSNWQANWYGSTCWSMRFITAGNEPESEPETRALKNFLLDRKVEAVISYHSAANNVFAGGYPHDSVSIDLANALTSVSPYYFLSRQVRNVLISAS